MESLYLSDITEHEQWFARYAERQCAREQENDAPLRLKQKHSANVLNNARTIIQSEPVSPLIVRASLLAALYHDIARFEQYLRYRTFRDADSCNHGQLGVRLLKQERRLDAEPAEVRRLVSVAVGLHNRYDLPRHLALDYYLTTCVVRDADKLDIVRIMNEELTGKNAPSQAVVLHLPDDPDIFSPAVIAAALGGAVPAYADLRSVNDFRLLLGTWIDDLHFASSRKRFIQMGAAYHLVESLPDNTAYGAARAHVLQRLESFA